METPLQENSRLRKEAALLDDAITLQESGMHQLYMEAKLLDTLEESDKPNLDLMELKKTINRNMIDAKIRLEALKSKRSTYLSEEEYTMERLKLIEEGCG